MPDYGVTNSELYDISILQARARNSYSGLGQALAMHELQRALSVLTFSVERLQLLHFLFVLNSRSDQKRRYTYASH